MRRVSTLLFVFSALAAAQSYTISTFAGGGVGDGGAATSAGVNSPGSVAVDASGNLYIADIGNYRVRKVAAGTGIITTVAGNGSYVYSGDGGPAVSAGLTAAGVAPDASGNLYIRNTGNNRIRKVAAGAATSATLSNSAGSGGITVDASGNLYIADTGNNRVRKVAADTGIITTFAGSGSIGTGFGGFGGGGLTTQQAIAQFITGAEFLGKIGS